jgi:hypothetical protein
MLQAEQAAMTVTAVIHQQVAPPMVVLAELAPAEYTMAIPPPIVLAIMVEV